MYRVVIGGKKCQGPGVAVVLEAGEQEVVHRVLRGLVLDALAEGGDLTIGRTLRLHVLLELGLVELLEREGLGPLVLFGLRRTWKSRLSKSIVGWLRSARR